MGAISFDTLKFARKLKAAGVPETQAEAQAEVLAEAFLHNLDELVTRDRLDARFAEFEGRMDARFTELEGRMDARFIEIEGKFRLMYWMMGLIAASTVPVALQQLFG